MRLARRAAKVLLSIIILCEAYFVWQLWIHGPPMVATRVQETKPGEMSFRMIPAPVSTLDCLVLVVVLALQVALVGFLWWSRRKIASK
jgi:hypothetical protein